MASRTSIRISKTFYQIVVLSFMGILLWVGWSIYQAMMVPPKLTVDPQMLAPLPSEWSDEVVSKVTSRTQLAGQIDELFGQSYESLIVASESAVASPSGLR